MEDKRIIDDKLTGSQNWITWKFQLKHILLTKGLYGSMSMDLLCLVGGATAERAKHQSESQKALSIITLSVSTSQLYLITSCGEPKEAWDVLEKHFERETLSNQLKKQYF